MARRGICGEELPDIRGGARRRLRQIEIEFGPARARKRPFVLEAPLHLVAAFADGELHRRLIHNAIVDAFEPIVEEAQLIAPSLLGIEGMYMSAGVDAQLLVRRSSAHEGLGVAAQ